MTVPTSSDADWFAFVEQLEADMVGLEAALSNESDLPELAPMPSSSMGPIPLELKDRVERTLRAVVELEQAIANRLEMVARELASGSPRRHDLRPAYGALDVGC